MPRANRYFTKGHHYHVTQRCHDRQFLLKFQRERNAYRHLLREKLHTLSRSLSLLGYCITSNHVHLLLTVHDGKALPLLMRMVSGEFAQAYNRRRRRSGALWADRYHATLIESGTHLLRCLRYIDMNMVRAGVVQHPEQWDWCGYREITGQRKRYRLIQQHPLLHAVDAEPYPERFAQHYCEFIDDGLKEIALRREARWTESLAVGGEQFVRRTMQTIRNRRRLALLDPGTGDGDWVLQESPEAIQKKNP